VGSPLESNLAAGFDRLSQANRSGESFRLGQNGLLWVATSNDSHGHRLAPRLGDRPPRCQPCTMIQSFPNTEPLRHNTANSPH